MTDDWVSMIIIFAVIVANFDVEITSEVHRGLSAAAWLCWRPGMSEEDTV